MFQKITSFLSYNPRTGMGKA
jgi:hypothetical protein